MAANSNPQAKPGIDRSVGNIYERLDQARRKRDKILDPPAPANSDEKVKGTPVIRQRSFPKLQPQLPQLEMPEVAESPRWDWLINVGLGLVIFLVIFVFAVS